MDNKLHEIAELLVLVNKKWQLEWNKIKLGGISNSHSSILEILDGEGPQQLTSLANALFVTTGGITGLSDKLVELGLANKRKDEKDRRIVYLEITVQGRKALQEVREHKRRLFYQIFGVLSDVEVDQLLDIYRKLAGNGQSAQSKDHHFSKLRNKVAVVTRACSDAGKSIVHLFAQEGASVVAVDPDAKGIEALVKGIQSTGGTVTGIVEGAEGYDVRQSLDEAVRMYGSLDIMVHLADAESKRKLPSVDGNDDRWSDSAAAALESPLQMTRKSLSIMIGQGGGVIIHTALLNDLAGSGMDELDTVVQHGVIGLVKQIGPQYAGAGIRCNAIAYDSAAVAESRAFSDIARIALFLASEDSNLINGTVVTAGAGHSAR